MFAVSLVGSSVPSVLVAAPSPPTTKPTPPHFTATAAPSTSAQNSARTSLQDFGDPCSTCCLLAPSIKSLSPSISVGVACIERVRRACATTPKDLEEQGAAVTQLLPCVVAYLHCSIYMP